MTLMVVNWWPARDVTIVRSGWVTRSGPAQDNSSYRYTGKILREQRGNSSQAGPGQESVK